MCKSTDWKLAVDFKYTAKETPYQTLMLEAVFTMLSTRGHTMTTVTTVPMVERASLFQEAANHATALDWLSI